MPHRTLAVLLMAFALPIAWAGPPPEPLLSSSFEGDLEGWTLQLNRGAQAELSYVEDAVMDAQALSIRPTLLCAPDDRALPTNVHIWYDSFPLQAGSRYRLSVWAKAEGASRRFTLGGRRATEAVSLGGTLCEAGEQWRRFEHVFAPTEDTPDLRLQIICGDDLRALLLDRVKFEQVPEGEPLPADFLAWGDRWARPEVWQGEVLTDPDAPLVRLSGSACYLRDLPPWFRFDLFLRAEGPGSVTLGYEGTDPTVLELRPGRVLPVMFERGPAQPGQLLANRDLTPSRLQIVAGDAPVEIVRMEGRELLPPRADGDTEREQYTDPETGARIVRLTHSPYNDKHAYYDLSPWSPDGSMILFCSALPGEKRSSVWVMQADGANLRRLADAESWSYHTGNFPGWAPDGRSVYFHTWRVVDGQRTSGTARVWLDDLHEDFLPLSARQVNMVDGRLLETVSNPDEPQRGLFCYDQDGTNRRLLASMAAIDALSPSRQQGEGLRMNLQNCKWSPDGSKCFVVFARRDDQGRARAVEVYTMRDDGSELRYALTMSHHPMWHSDSEHVIFNWTDGLYIVNWDGTALRKLSDCNQGHPSVSPDGSLIATDGYAGDWRDSLVLIDPRTGDWRRLCGVPTVHGRSHETGTHPHPCWAPDGRSLIYDSDQTGHCQLYQVFIDGVAEALLND